MKKMEEDYRCVGGHGYWFFIYNKIDLKIYKCLWEGIAIESLKL